MSLAEDLSPSGPRFESAQAFLDWAERQPERWELWDGVARLAPRGMTGGSRSHAQMARNALNVLSARLGEGPCEALGSDFAVTLGATRLAYPDVSVSCDPGEEKATASPVVIIEVLSPSTASYDYGGKASAYRRLPSLRHLVLLRQDRVEAQHFHREEAGQEFALTELDRVDGRLRLTAVGVEVALAELYAGVRLGG